MKFRLRQVMGLLLLVAQGAIGQTRLWPEDQAASVPDFFSFRAQLQGAVVRRDADAVMSALNKDVRLSFGGDHGLDDFRKLWSPSAPDSRLWEVLGSVLALGGTFAADGSFTAPYVFSRWPEDRDAYSGMAVLGSDVRVREAASPEAPVIQVLAFSIVEAAAGTAPSDSRWNAVKLLSGQTGFVDARYLRSPLDYRIHFARVDGRWQVMSFLAGD
jgi:hypothetical protein